MVLKSSVKLEFAFVGVLSATAIVLLEGETLIDWPLLCTFLGVNASWNELFDPE